MLVGGGRSSANAGPTPRRRVPDVLDRSRFGVWKGVRGDNAAFPGTVCRCSEFYGKSILEDLVLDVGAGSLKLRVLTTGVDALTLCTHHDENT